MAGSDGGPRGDRAGAPKAYSRFVGAAFLALIAVATVNLLSTEDSGLIGVRKEKHERPLPAFAAPDARGSLAGDANIAQDDCETPRNPCPPADRRRPACAVRGKGVITICDWFRRPLVLSFWFTRGGDCEDQQDVVDRVAARYAGRAGFVSIDVHDSRRTVQRLIATHGWRIPVGLDPDGAVSDLYRVGGCPTIVYAFPGGILQSASIGRLDEAGLSRRVDTLLSESALRERASR